MVMCKESSKPSQLSTKLSTIWRINDYLSKQIDNRLIVDIIDTPGHPGYRQLTRTVSFPIHSNYLEPPAMWLFPMSILQSCLALHAHRGVWQRPDVEPRASLAAACLTETQEPTPKCPFLDHQSIPGYLC